MADKVSKDYDYKSRKTYTGKGRLGWLSPDGDFLEVDWGAHGSEAIKIIRESGWERDFAARSTIINASDYLCGRGYCLLHDPGRSFPKATHIVPLTRHQREYLYGYFFDLGDRAMAEGYLTGDIW